MNNLNYNRNQFNTQNSLAIEQSNVQWRRNLNTANTAGINAVNQANAMNAFNLSNQALSFYVARNERLLLSGNMMQVKMLMNKKQNCQ